MANNFLTISGILFMSFIVFAIAFLAMSYSFIINEKRDTMSKNAEEASHLVSAYSMQWSLDSFEVRMQIASMSQTSGFHIMICGTDGEVISCSDRELNCGHIGATMDLNILHKIDSHSGYSGASTLGGMFSEKRYVVADNIVSPYNDENIGYIILSVNNHSMSVLWRQFSGMLLSVSLFVIAVAFLASFAMSKKQAEPINEMAAAANKFAKGDYSIRVKNDRDDEIGYLADAFNSMADSIERSEKLRREFIANVSHELKTPMTTITGFADGIIDGTIPKEKELDYLQVISSETKRLSRMVRSMLKMSQLQAMDKNVILQKNFDVAEVVRLALLSLEQKINNKSLSVEAELPEEPVVVRGEQDSIMQVVYNLIDNATKFAESGSQLKIDLWKKGAKAYVSVENTGSTIPKDELPLIFDRFHKADKSRNMDKDGVGLGLYIVKTILNNHNEDIFVSSEDGVTKFTFTLTLK